MLLRWKKDAGLACLDYHGSIGRFSYPEHRHRGAWELLLVLSGTVEHTVNGERLEQPAGTATLVREGDRHQVAGERIEFANLGFAAGVVAGLARLPESGGRAVAALRKAPGPLWCRIPAAELERLKAAIDALDTRLAAAPAADAGLHLLAVLVPVLLGCHARLAGAAPAAAPGWLEPVQALLRDHDRPVPDLAGLRRLAGVSAAHLARSCRRHLGCSPSEFLNRCRVQRAAVLLKGRPDLTVAAVAAACGFADRTYFAWCFRRALGVSPQAWRTRQELVDAREVDPWQHG